MYDQFGFYWEGKFYFDKCLSMGCRTNCKKFEEFSTAIEWIAHTKPDIAHAYVVHIWDVFFLIENSQQSTLSKFRKLESNENYNHLLFSYKNAFFLNSCLFIDIGTIDYFKLTARYLLLALITSLVFSTSLLNRPQFWTLCKSNK